MKNRLLQLVLFFKKTWILLVSIIVGISALLNSLTPWQPTISNISDRVENHLAWEQVKPEQSNEILILIAPFRYLNVNNNEEYKRAGQQIKKLFSTYSHKIPLTVRVEYLPHPIKDVNSIEDAEIFAQKKNATIVIWGDIAETHNEISYLNRIYRKNNLNWYFSEFSVQQINEHQKTRLINVEGYSEFVNRDLPCALTFLAHIAIADVLFLQQEAMLAKDLYTSAIDHNCSSNGTSIRYGMAEIYQRLMEIRSLTDDAGARSDLQELLTRYQAIGSENSRHLLSEISLRSVIEKFDNEDLLKILVTVNNILEENSNNIQLSNLHVDALIMRADIYEIIGKGDEARIDRERAINILDSFKDPIRDFGILSRQIMLNHKIGAYQNVKELINLSINVYDSDKISLLARKLAEFDFLSAIENKDYSNATLAAEKLISNSLTPLYKGDAYRRVAVFYSDKIKNPIKAKELREKLLNEGVPSSWDFHNLGLWYLNEGNCEEAHVLFEKALKIHRFLAAMGGYLISSICLENRSDFSKVLEPELLEVKKEFLEIKHTDHTQALFRTYLLKLEATKAFFNKEQWIIRQYTSDEINEFVGFAIENFLVSRNTNFAIWMLESIIDIDENDNLAKEYLGYLYSYKARQFFESNQFEKALEVLIKASHCCPLDARIADWLDKIIATRGIENIPQTLRPDNVRLTDFSQARNGEEMP